MTFDQALHRASVPAPGAFHVTVGGARRDSRYPQYPQYLYGSARRGVASVAVAGESVRLTLASAVELNQWVRVRYTEPSANPLRGVTGLAVASFPDRAVTNDMPNTVPAARNLRVTIPFDRDLKPLSCPQPDAWIVRSNGKRQRVVYVDCRNPRSVALGLSSYADPITSHQATVSYDKNLATILIVGLPLRYANDNSEVPSFWNRPLDYLVAADTTGPKFRSARADGATLTLVFDEDLDTASVPPGGAFEVRTLGRFEDSECPERIDYLSCRHTGVGAVRISGTTVRVSLNGPVPLRPGFAYLGYTPPATNALQDPAGNRVTGIGSGKQIPVRPRIRVSGVHAAGGVAIDGASVTLTLASAVTRTDTVELRYAGGRNPLRDLSDNAVASFADRAVRNNTPGAAPPVGAFTDEGGGCDTCPDAPGGAATPGPGRGEITVAWTPAATGAAATSWRVLALQTGSNVFHSAVLDSPDREHIFSDLDVSRTYRIAVIGVGANGNGDRAESAPIAPFDAPEAGPTGNAGPSFRSSSVSGTQLRVTFDEPLDEGSAPRGDSFTVTTVPDGGAGGNGAVGNRPRSPSGDSPLRTLAGTGTASVSGATVTVTLDRAVAPGERVMVSYTRSGANALRDLAGAAAASFSRRPASNVAPAAVTDVAVSSDAGADSTYGIGDTIRVRGDLRRAGRRDGVTAAEDQDGPALGRVLGGLRGRRRHRQPDLRLPGGGAEHRAVGNRGTCEHAGTQRRDDPGGGRGRRAGACGPRPRREPQSRLADAAGQHGRADRGDRRGGGLGRGRGQAPTASATRSACG